MSLRAKHHKRIAHYLDGHRCPAPGGGIASLLEHPDECALGLFEDRVGPANLEQVGVRQGEQGVASERADERAGVHRARWFDVNE